MSRFLCSAAFTIVVLVIVSPVGAGEPNDIVNSLITSNAIEILPEPLRAILEPGLRTAPESEEAETPQDNKKKQSRKNCASRHVMLDVAAQSPDIEARSSAARIFPRNREQAERLYHKHRQTSGGFLPWEIQNQYAGLVKAFRARDRQAAVKEAASLISLCGAAAMPFNTTFDMLGKSGGHLHWEPSKTEAEGARHASISRRFEGALVDRLLSRLEFEVRISPQRLRTITCPLAETFSVLLRSHDAIGLVLRIDRELTKDLSIHDRETFMRNYGAYYSKLAEEAGWILESRLEDGALLSANLMLAAWTEVGRPGPSLFPSPTEKPAPKEDAKPAARPGPVPMPQTADPTASRGKYVASRGSKTYHLSTCYHARRIKPSNMVFFDSAEEAEASGRKPCRSCLKTPADDTKPKPEPKSQPRGKP